MKKLFMGIIIMVGVFTAVCACDIKEPEMTDEQIVSIYLEDQGMELISYNGISEHEATVDGDIEKYYDYRAIDYKNGHTFAGDVLASYAKHKAENYISNR